MYSKLPGEVGETPVKVVFQGVEPGSPEAQLLYQQNMGVISSFHQKARQNRLISEQPGASMHQALPDGGLLRYIYNSGQETIVVRLNPQRPAVRPGVAPPRNPRRADPKLAIDVVFEPESYLAQELRSFTRRGQPGLAGTPGVYTTWKSGRIIVLPTGSGFDFELPAGTYSRFPFHLGFPFQQVYLDANGNYGNAMEVSYASSADLVRWGSDPNILATLKSLDTSGATFGDFTEFLGQQGVFTSRGASDIGDSANYDAGVAEIGATASQRLSATYAIVYELGTRTNTYPTPPMEPAERSREMVWLAEYWYRVPMTVDIQQLDLLIAESRFDVRNVVGVVADPESDAPYMSASPGWATPQPEDRRLKWQDPDLADIEVLRALSIEAGAGLPGTMGAGFVAAMKSPPVGPVPDPVDFDVYISSSNGRRYNPPPGQQDGPIDTPAQMSDLLTTVDTSLRFRIRVREFGDVEPVPVVVTTSADYRSSYTQVPTAPSVIQGYDRVSLVEPDLRWAFAAEPGWTDAGGEPTDPQAPKMGDVLADTGPLIKDVTGPPDADEVYYEEISWTGPLTDMTKVATIRWFPATRPGEVGTAKITPT